MNREEYENLRNQLVESYNQSLVDLSISNQVLHGLTALIAKKKITDVNTGEVQFVKIPLVSPAVPKGTMLIYVSTLTGKQINLYVSPVFLIEDVKA